MLAGYWEFMVAREPSLYVQPPIAPMLGRLVRELPRGDYVYEPKWDGVRCIAFRCGDQVELRSRNDRPLGRYFPELVAALRAPAEQRFVVDGEILVRAGAGRYDFATLMARLHPAAARVSLLSARSPATFVVFDALAVGSRDLRGQPFSDRRATLVGLVGAEDERVRVTPATSDPAVAAGWWSPTARPGRVSMA